MRNTDQLRENADAARRFEPLKTAEIEQLRDACLAAGPTLCADCDGRCSGAAGTKAALGDLTRFLTYHEHHGYRAEARRQYAATRPEARDWSGADLEAARASLPQQARLRPAPPPGRTPPGVRRGFPVIANRGPVGGIVPGRPFCQEKLVGLALPS